MATFGEMRSSMAYPNGGTVEILSAIDGQSLTISNETNLCIIKSVVPLATLNISMPPNPMADQIIRIVTDQIISALTINANLNQTILNSPTSLAIGDFCGFIYIAEDKKWYRIS